MAASRVLDVRLLAGGIASGWFMAGPTVAEARMNDLDLIRRMAGGDESAMAALYDRYGTVLHAVVYRIVGQRADAEEVVMEAFAQAWREATRFEAGRGSVAAWLTMIGRSRALDLIRSRERRDRLTTSAAREDAASAPAMGSWGIDPGYQVEQSERQRRVADALELLSPAQRQAIEMAYYDGLSQSEIAEKLNEPLGTVKTRVRLGMMKLKEALRPYYYEPAV